MRLLEARLLWIVIASLFAVASIALVLHTVAQGNDFKVFWWASRHFFQGEEIYSVQRDGAMVFKYPPWILPFFLPLSLFSIEIAAWIWGIIQVLCIFYCAYWLYQKNCRLLIVVTSLILFWGIWAVHTLDGQIVVVLLASLLFFWNSFQKSTVGIFMILTALSVKGFTFIPCFSFFRDRWGWKGRRGWRFLKDGILTIAAFLILSLPALYVSQEKNLGVLFRSWAEAAGSGGELFAGDQVRGRENQGLPAMLARASRTPGKDLGADFTFFILLSLFLVPTWAWVSRDLEPHHRWAGWLGLTAALHPLAWFHLFALSFPLCSFALDQSFRRSKVLFIKTLSVLGILCVAVFTEKTLGKTIGHFLEMASIKSWGVIFCMAALVLARKSTKTN